MQSKFEIGSSWRTRGGWRAVVVGHGDDVTMRAWHDVVLEREQVQFHFKATGECVRSSEVKNLLNTGDLITPWADPRTGEFWVNVYDDKKPSIGNVYVYKSREEADSFEEFYKRLACVRVKWTEGEGL